jgi:hypothetical protein
MFTSQTSIDLTAKAEIMDTLDHAPQSDGSRSRAYRVRCAPRKKTLEL